MTYLVVILGEVVPKSICLAAHRSGGAWPVAAPMDVFMTLAAPFLVFMTASTRVVLKAFGVHLMREARRAFAGGTEADRLRQPPSGRAGADRRRR